MGIQQLPPPPSEVPDQWDTYMCHVDDAPASFLVNLWYRDQSPLDGVDTLYYWNCPMGIPGEHGMGNGAEAQQFQPVEDVISGRLVSMGFYPVGRLRNQGVWQLTYFGPPGQDAPFNKVVSEGLQGSAYDRFDAGWRHDPEWTYYHDFLHPTLQQLRWMADLKVVEALNSSGDPLHPTRRVDHWAFFSDPGGRDAWVAEACGAGFQLEAKKDDAEGPNSFGAQVWREDPIELDHISGVTWHLTELAQKCGGEYDGWETFLVRVEN